MATTNVPALRRQLKRRLNYSRMKKGICWILMMSSWAILTHAQPVNKQIGKLVKAYAELGKFNGSILVAVKGNIVFQKGYGYKDVKKKTLNDANTVYQIASVTKSFTAALILKLVELNRLSLTDTVSKFYPSFPNGDNITIKQLLSHTSGIPDSEGSEEAEFIAMMSQRPVYFSPGTDWRYSNSGYILLGYISQKVTGISYYDAIRAYLFQPLQMTHSGFDFIGLSSPDKATGYWEYPQSDTTSAATLIDYSSPRAAGAIYSTVGDLYRWHQGLQMGKVVGLPLLEQAYRPVKNNYGYGWIIDSVAQTRLVWHSGDIWGFKSELARVPADDICIIMLNNIEEVDLHIITRKILAILHHQTYQLPARSKVHLSARVLQDYVGDYQMRPGEWIKVRVEQNHLMATTNRKEELYAQEKDIFLVDDGKKQLRVVFSRDATGLVTNLSFTVNGQTMLCPKSE